MALALALAVLQEANVEALIRRLGDDSIEARRAAFAELAAFGMRIESELRRHETDADPDVAADVRRLIERIDLLHYSGELAADGIPERWLSSNLDLVAKLKRGEPEDFLDVVKVSRGASGPPAYTSMLHGKDASALFNYLLKRLRAAPPPPERTTRLFAQMLHSATWVGRGDGMATLDALHDWNLAGFLAILQPRHTSDLNSEVEYLLRAYHNPRFNKRVLDGDVPWEIVPRTIDALRRVRTPELLPELLDAARSDDVRRRALAADLMGAWRTDPAAAIPELRRLAEDVPEVGVPALRSLLLLGDPTLPERAKASLLDEHPGVRAAAIEVGAALQLKEIDEAVLAGLESESWPLQRAAVEAAGTLAIAEAIPKLLAIGDDSDNVIRALALAGADLSADEWMGLSDRSRPALAGAMVLGGRLPAPESFRAILRDGSNRGWWTLIAWMVHEADAATRDAYDRVLLEEYSYSAGCVLIAYADGDPDRLGRMLDRLADHENARYAREAPTSASKIGVNLSLERTARLLAHDDPGVRRSAAIHASRAGYRDLAPTILDDLKTTPVDSATIESLISALGTLAHAPARDELLRLLEFSPIPPERIGPALVALGTERPRSKVDAWFESDDERMVRAALELSEPADLERIRPLLDHPSDLVRGAAVAAWARAAPDSAAERMREVARTSSRWVRDGVLRALGTVPDAETLIILAEHEPPGFSDYLARIVRTWYRRGRLPRDRIEPLLRRGVEEHMAFTYAAVEAYMEEGWPEGIELEVGKGHPVTAAAWLDRGDDRALIPALLHLPQIYNDSENAAWLLVALNGLADAKAYGRLKGVRVKADDPEPLRTIAAAAGLTLDDRATIRWPEGRTDLSAHEWLAVLARDARQKRAPIVEKGALKLVSWSDAMRLWRAEHVRRAAVRR